MSLEALEYALSITAACAVVAMPSFQNPLVLRCPRRPSAAC